MTRETGQAHEHGLALGQTVRQLRSERGLSLRALAELLQVSPATVSAMENGKTGISAERIARLAEEFGVPVERMFAYAHVGETADQPAVPAHPSAPDIPGGGHGAARARLKGPDWRSYAPLDLGAALSGALSSFLEFGYHGATMRTIAERANLSVPGLYHYYSSKQEMLVALLDLTMKDLRVRSLRARDQGHDPVERFALLVECLALYHTHRQQLGFVGASEMRSLAPDARRRVAAMRRDLQCMVDHEVEQAVLSGEFKTTRPCEAARAVVTMCTALPQWFRDTGPSTAEQIAEQYVDFALDLVQCVPERRGRPTEDTRVA
jgi:AcrR family transcriptional regulator/transcriptional regulator with XRE-family HTH domain